MHVQKLKKIMDLQQEAYEEIEDFSRRTHDNIKQKKKEGS